MQKAAACLLVVISTTVGYKRQAKDKKGQRRHADVSKVGLYLVSRGFVMQPKLCIAQSSQVHVHKPLYVLRFSVALLIKTLNLFASLTVTHQTLQLIAARTACM